MTWQIRVRSYCTALMLNLATLGTVPERPAGPRIGMEREMDLGPGRFDRRESIGETVVTVPLVVSQPSRSGPHAN